MGGNKKRGGKMNEEEAYEMMEKEGEVAILEAELDSVYGFSDILEGELRENREEIQDLGSTLAEKDEMIADLQEELCAQDNKIADLQIKVSRGSRFFKIIRFRKKRSQ